MTLRSGLYCVTPDPSVDLSFEQIYRQCEFALQRGAISLLQYRSKSADQSLRLVQAARLNSLVKRYNRQLIINDDLAIAEQIGAGVHLGQDDQSCLVARDLLGPSAIIGVSCYSELTLARIAKEAGASYIAFGAYRPSLTKPNAVTLDPEVFLAALDLGLPVCVIGGVEADDWLELKGQGVHLAACINGLFDTKPANFQLKLANWLEVLDA